MNPEHRSTRRSALALALCGCPLAACAFDLGGLLPVQGSGRVTRRELATGAFDAIDIAGDVDLALEQGQPPQVAIETDDNLQPLIDVQVHDGTLGLRLRGRLAPTRLSIVARVWTLRSLAVSGSGRIQGDSLVAKHLQLRLGGSGVVRIGALTAETLDIEIGGSGSARLAGRANALRAALGGSAELDARALEVRRVRAAVGGSGRARLWAADTLDGSVAGSGELLYRGDPVLGVARSGAGRLARLP